MDDNKINFRDGLSIDEAKVSVLIILCVLAFLYAFVMYAIKGDISDNFTSVLQVLVIVIGGVNVGNAVVDLFKKKG